MKAIRREARGAIPHLSVLVLLVVAVIAAAAVFILFFPQGPDTSTQACPTGECNTQTTTIHFAVDLNLQGCQPWFGSATPQINSLNAYDTTAGPSAKIGHGWDLFGTTMNLWATYYITYPSGKTYTWTSTQYAVTSGNGACSNGIDIFGYFTGPTGAYYIGATAYAQAINCWPGACSTQSTTITARAFGL